MHRRIHIQRRKGRRRKIPFIYVIRRKGTLRPTLLFAKEGIYAVWIFIPINCSKLKYNP